MGITESQIYCNQTKVGYTESLKGKTNPIRGNGKKLRLVIFMRSSMYNCEEVGMII